MMRSRCSSFEHWRRLASLSYWGWIIGRPTVWVTDVVPDLGRDLRDFVQRGLRGYAESDLYSLDLYLASFIPSALRDIRPALLDQPGAMLPYVVKGYYEEWPPHDTTEEEWGMARRRWEEVLEGMIAGWEMVHDIRSHDVELLPGETRQQRFRREKRTIKRGMRLMGKHILNLWI